MSHLLSLTQQRTVKNKQALEVIDSNLQGYCCLTTIFFQVFVRVRPSKV